MQERVAFVLSVEEQLEAALAFVLVEAHSHTPFAFVTVEEEEEEEQRVEEEQRQVVRRRQRVVLAVVVPIVDFFVCFAGSTFCLPFVMHVAS